MAPPLRSTTVPRRIGGLVLHGRNGSPSIVTRGITPTNRTPPDVVPHAVPSFGLQAMPSIGMPHQPGTFNPAVAPGALSTHNNNTVIRYLQSPPTIPVPAGHPGGPQAQVVGTSERLIAGGYQRPLSPCLTPDQPIGTSAVVERVPLNSARFGRELAANSSSVVATKFSYLPHMSPLANSSTNLKCTPHLFSQPRPPLGPPTLVPNLYQASSSLVGGSFSPRRSDLGTLSTMAPPGAFLSKGNEPGDWSNLLNQRVHAGLPSITPNALRIRQSEPPYQAQPISSNSLFSFGLGPGSYAGLRAAEPLIALPLTKAGVPVSKETSHQSDHSTAYLPAAGTEQEAPHHAISDTGATFGEEVKSKRGEIVAPLAEGVATTNPSLKRPRRIAGAARASKQLINQPFRRMRQSRQKKLSHELMAIQSRASAMEQYILHLQTEIASTQLLAQAPPSPSNVPAAVKVVPDAPTDAPAITPLMAEISANTRTARAIEYSLTSVDGSGPYDESTTAMWTALEANPLGLSPTSLLPASHRGNAVGTSVELLVSLAGQLLSSVEKLQKLVANLIIAQGSGVSAGLAQGSPSRKALSGSWTPEPSPAKRETSGRLPPTIEGSVAESSGSVEKKDGEEAFECHTENKAAYEGAAGPTASSASNDNGPNDNGVGPTASENGMRTFETCSVSPDVLSPNSDHLVADEACANRNAPLETTAMYRSVSGDSAVEDSVSEEGFETHTAAPPSPFLNTESN